MNMNCMQMIILAVLLVLGAAAVVGGALHGGKRHECLAQENEEG